MARTTLIALVAVMAAACSAQHYLHGARVAESGTPLGSVTASWDVGVCVDTEGQSAGAPALQYHLVEGAAGPELYERTADGSGSFVTNRWEDASGTHYYQWVRNTGWEMIITGPGQPGVRNVYVDAQTSDAGRPQGPIAATCPLTPAAAP